MIDSARPNPDRLLVILRTAKNPLEYLTPNDWALITDRAKMMSFEPGDVLIKNGTQTKKVYLLLKGIARVETSSKKAISRIGPGEVCGEMAFLEGSHASASVIAHEKLQAYELEWSTLQDLFELYPHLASRFFRSLAVNLSRRLRAQISVQ